MTKSPIPLYGLLWALLSITALMHASSAMAWGKEGHMAVGAIADQLLKDTRAGREVRKLLKDGESLESISVWADCVKGYCGKLTPEMKDFIRANKAHHAFHYTDVPFQAKTYEEGGVGTEMNDVVHTLNRCIATLKEAKDRKPKPYGLSRREALLLLAHLVGDIHQPLHVGSAYVDANGHFANKVLQRDIDNGTIFETQGDNDLVIGSRPLHAYWDSQAVRYAMRRVDARKPRAFASALIAMHPDIPHIAGVSTVWPYAWATEALAVSAKAHDGLKLEKRKQINGRNGSPHDVWPVSVPQDYAKTVSTMATRQLTLAGYRLAAVLMDVWP